jgi:hypothetical protein
VKDPEMAILPPNSEGPLTVKTTYERSHEEEAEAQEIHRLDKLAKAYRALQRESKLKHR